MDVDELFRAAALPPVAVDTESALAATARRGRSRRRRRTALAGVAAAVTAIGLVTSAVVLAGGDGDDGRVATGPTDVPAAGGPDAGPSPTAPATAPPAAPATTPPATPEPGDPASWALPPGAAPDPAASTVDVLVARTGCNAGETGEVLRPGVVVTDTQVVVTFTVSAPPGDAIATCPGNIPVPVTVDVGQALGARALVDGSCAASDAPAGDCADGGVRWRPVGAAPVTASPHACADDAEGGTTDVATEPDWRRYADYAPWTDRAGCLVRIDVLAELAGPEHCGWEGTRLLVTGPSLGERYTEAGDAVQYVRDPDGAYGVPDLVAGLDTDAVLSSTAVDSGFRHGDVELWVDPADPSAVWLVAPDHIERWPAGDPPVCS